MPNDTDIMAGVHAPPTVLELHDIQGDILIGLPKKFQVFVFFSIEDVALFKARFRASLLNVVTTTEQVEQQMAQIAASKRAGHTDLLPIFGFNVAFTSPGMTLLVGSSAGMDASFVAGAKAQALNPQPVAAVPGIGINDPQDGSGRLSTWSPDYLNDEAIHGVMMFTGPQSAPVLAHVHNALTELGSSISEVRREVGQVRPGLESGHEHFGYLDGVSQPGVRGLTKRTDPFTRPNEGLPGQELLWPGMFVFGYETQILPTTPPTAPIVDEFAPAPPVPLPPSLDWMRNGSLMVFRRLNQKVPEFRAFSAQQGAALGVDPVLLEARMVGRWKSGAPLSITPLQDEPQLAAKPAENNDFVFSSDQFQRACPYAAHIRKVNPRDDFAVPASSATDANAHAAVLVRRIMRAGIAFGPEVTREETISRTTSEERGLLFVCYQTSINNQFEFVQTAWANNPGFIFNKVRPGTGTSLTVGFDPLIGQNVPADGPARSSDEPVPNYPTGSVRTTLQMPEPFVVPTGGSYAFVPSITALRTKLLVG